MWQPKADISRRKWFFFIIQFYHWMEISGLKIYHHIHIWTWVSGRSFIPLHNKRESDKVMHNGNQSGASICDAAAHKLSAAGSKLWGDSLSGDECGTQRVGRDRPWGRRSVPLVEVFIKTEICFCILKCYFSPNLLQILISKTCLFISQQLQGCSELLVPADFPHRKGFLLSISGLCF